MTSITHNNTPWFTSDALGAEFLAARSDAAGYKRPVLHRFATSTPVQYRRLSGHLLAFGFEVTDNPGDLHLIGDEIGLTVRKKLDMTPETVASTRRTLEAAVEEFGGRYEGWSTYVIIVARRQLRREKIEAMRGRVPAPRRRV